MPTERQKSIARQLTQLIPRVPYIDAEAIRDAAGSRHMRDLPTASALWLATLAHIRHQHTDYDALRDEGYDRDEALFFVIDDVNAVLDRWGSTRQLTSEPGDDDEDMPAEDGKGRLAPKQRPRPDAD
ncbi:DUF2293 domain-containing protein [Aureimonas sp. Leaf324]|jgi:hypothetical protein|uniref:DUF2293 domain-containing protein n=1 Tax=Aureimonas sp. Leaf324 TaxID=1736336 RepID=UPI0006FACEB9|nr:DUF2293 domain-containing protein [Aureimonas sp. Leaf324]KQQ91123.1 hypothetical protein ASF65_00915 [Aureimonas sp. Leaf324]